MVISAPRIERPQPINVIKVSALKCPVNALTEKSYIKAIVLS